MFNIEKFISEKVTSRPLSMFEGDIRDNREPLSKEIEGNERAHFVFQIPGRKGCRKIVDSFERLYKK